MVDAPFLETLKGMTWQEAGIETQMMAKQLALKLKYELPKMVTSLARGCISGDNMNHSLIVKTGFTISGRRDVTPENKHTCTPPPTVPWLQFCVINKASYTLSEALSFQEGTTGKNKTN